MSLFSRRTMLAAGGSAALMPLALRAGPAAARASRPAPVGGPLVTLRTPLRAYDSRTDTVLLGGDKIAADEAIIVTVGVPDEERFLVSVFLNVTVTETEGAGFLRVFATDPSGTIAPPETSNVNWYGDGQTLANFVLSGVGPEFGVEIYCGGAGRTHLIVDVQGYVAFPLDIAT